MAHSIIHQLQSAGVLASEKLKIEEKQGRNTGIELRQLSMAFIKARPIKDKLTALQKQEPARDSHFKHRSA